MKVVIQGLEQTEISEANKDAVIKTLINKLDELVPDTQEDLKIAHVKINQRADWGLEVSVDLKLADQDLYAQAREDELTTALVAVREKLEKQIKKFKEQTRPY